MSAEQDPRDVGLDGRLADEQLVGDLPVGKSVSDQYEGFALAAGLSVACLSVQGNRLGLIGPKTRIFGIAAGIILLASMVAYPMPAMAALGPSHVAAAALFDDFAPDERSELLRLLQKVADSLRARGIEVPPTIKVDPPPALGGRSA